MTAAEMDIVIGAKVDDAVTGLKQVQTQLTQTGQTATTTAAATTNTTRAFAGLSNAVQNIPNGVDAVSGSLADGLIPALGEFELITEVSKVAIKALVSAFVTWISTNDDVTESQRKLNQAMASSLGHADAEIAGLNGLLKVAQDLTESHSARLNALQELQKEYPNYLGNIKLEGINSDEASKAIDKLKEALVRKAQVQAITNLLIKTEEDLYLAQNATVSDNISLWDALWSTIKTGGGSAAALETINRGAQKQKDNVNDLQKTIDGLIKKLDDLKKAQAEAGDFFIKPPPTPKPPKEAKEYDITPRIKILKGNNLDIVTRDVPDVMDKVQKKLNGMPPLTIPAPKFDKDTLQKIQDETDIIMSGITDTIAAAAEGLGSALTGKGGFFGSILKVIGSSLEALGKYVITTSALVAKIRAAIDKAFLTGNPIAGIGIGIAMIALGAAMQNIGKAKFATGGIVTRPTLALVGEQGPERITPLGYEGQASNAMAGEVVFNISGNNLRGVLRRADQTAYNTF